MSLIVAVLVICAFTCKASTLVTATDFNLVYDPSDIASWYINDHTFVMGPAGQYHLIGITHTDPADPTFEVNLAHAISPNLTGGPWTKQPFTDGSRDTETHLWAPHIVYHGGLYYMFYCGGGASDETYQINLALSIDLYKWEKYGTLFTDGWDGRDPMVINLGPQFDDTWAIYYCATNPNSGNVTVDHVTYVRTSNDLLNWSNPQIVFNAGPTGSPYGGPTESPFVVRRGANFYLFSGSWDSYSDTRVFLSTDPFNFGDIIQKTAQQVGEIFSHAPEVVRDIDGNWFISRCGWGQGGVYLAPLQWSDGLDNASTSFPPPTLVPALPGNFTSPFTKFSSSAGQWVVTPHGLQGGYVYGDAFVVSTIAGGNFIYQVDVMLVTKDGNPTSSPSNWTRDGSAAAIIFRSQENPEEGSYALNIHTDTGGGVKLFKFPYEEIQNYEYYIAQDVTYQLKIEVSDNILVAYFNELGQSPQVVIKATDSSFSSGYLGLNVWQGSAFFQNVIFNTTA